MKNFQNLFKTSSTLNCQVSLEENKKWIVHKSCNNLCRSRISYFFRILEFIVGHLYSVNISYKTSCIFLHLHLTVEVKVHEQALNQYNAVCTARCIYSLRICKEEKKNGKCQTIFYKKEN